MAVNTSIKENISKPPMSESLIAQIEKTKKKRKMRDDENANDDDASEDKGLDKKSKSKGKSEKTVNKDEETTVKKQSKKMKNEATFTKPTATTTTTTTTTTIPPTSKKTTKKARNADQSSDVQWDVRAIVLSIFEEKRDTSVSLGKLRKLAVKRALKKYPSLSEEEIGEKLDNEICVVVKDGVASIPL